MISKNPIEPRFFYKKYIVFNLSPAHLNAFHIRKTCLNYNIIGVLTIFGI